ncbi:MAG: hypothetical protein RLZZ347_58 [Candidatus Parcubacteria bacterium]
MVMFKKNLRSVVVGMVLSVNAFLVMTTSVSAQSVPASKIKDFPDLMHFAMSTINDIIVFIVALGVVWVVYLAFLLIKVEGEKKDEARNSIIYGLVGIFVMISIWGLVNIFVNTFQLDNDTKPVPPTLSN